MTALTDGELRTLLAEDTERGWRAFIDEYTPTLLALIERAGVTARDEVMEIYLLACERLAADDCARLRRHDPSKGPLRAWLAVLIRHAAVDWVRSRVGRRRLFGAVREMSGFDRRVFELYYWEDRMPTEIAEILAREQPDVGAVFDSLARIDGVLTMRHRAELLALAARRRRAVSLDDAPERWDTVSDTGRDPETAFNDAEQRERLAAALRALPPEDAAIVRLKFLHGLSTRDVQRALHLEALPDTRVTGILQRLRALLTSAAATVAALYGVQP